MPGTDNLAPSDNFISQTGRSRGFPSLEKVLLTSLARFIKPKNSLDRRDLSPYTAGRPNQGVDLDFDNGTGLRGSSLLMHISF